MEDVPREVATTFTLEGTIMETDKLLENRMWVTVQKQEAIEEDVPKEMEYFIPIENGNFQRDINLHHSARTYQVTVRLPAMDKEDYYNDVAEFTLKNTDETIVRDVELTQIGIENNLQFAETVSGWNEGSEHFEIAGSFDSDEHTSVMFEIIKITSENSSICQSRMVPSKVTFHFTSVKELMKFSSTYRRGNAIITQQLYTSITTKQKHFLTLPNTLPLLITDYNLKTRALQSLKN